MKYKYENMINIVIFSKDRALQLDSLLRSIKDNFKLPISDFFVLYRSSSREFRKGYEKLIQKEIIPEIRWIEETTFRSNLISICQGLNRDSKVMFLVDDDIFFRPFNDRELLDKFSKRHLFISLRTDRSYEIDVVPEFISCNSYLEWNWRSTSKDLKRVTWHYPFSVDGNIFHTEDIQRIIISTEFKAPNSLESGMQKYKRSLLKSIWLLLRKKALSPLNAVLFNNPLNSVQLEGETWNAGLDVEKMNKEYLSGRRINNEVLYGTKPESVHFVVDLELEIVE